MYGKTREEAVLILLGLREYISLLVQHRRPGLLTLSFFSASLSSNSHMGPACVCVRVMN